MAVLKRSIVARPAARDLQRLIPGGGAMAKLIRAYSWAQTALGPITSWPQCLITATNILLQSPVPIVILWDRDGYMIYNDAYAVFAGQRHPKLLGSKVVNGWPEVADFNRHVLKQCLSGKALSYQDQQLTLLRNNVAEDVWMDLNYSPVLDETGKPKGVWSIVVETTAQVLSERQRSHTQAQLEAIFDSLPDGLYIAEGRQITHINQRGAEALGYTSPEAVPRDLDELYKQLSVRYARGGKHLSVKDSTIGNALRGQAVEHIGVRVTNPTTGKVQVLRTAGAPIRTKNGAIIGAVAINNDLTELYSLQEKVQQDAVHRRLLTQKTKLLKQQNEELTKLNATKDEFIALASHQLRTPATGVKQYVAMLMQGYAGPVTPEQEQYLERAYESNERQLNIIDDILRVAKVDIGKTRLRRQPYDVVALLRNILDEQADHLAERQQMLQLALPPKPLKTAVDLNHLHMAIGNIIDNAIKYSPDGKTLHVTLEKQGRSAVIAIRDEGVGIAKKDLDKLFQKFSRIPNPRSIAVGGTGLGLYWSKQIIELHGGTITVDSKPRRGTCFTVTLPTK